MKLVTGSVETNSISQSKKNVSIRLRQGGHYFSAKELAGIPKEVAQAVIMVESPKTVLVPSELFSAEYGLSCLKASGLTPQLNETVVSCQQGEITAIMALSNAVASALHERFSDGVTFTTPLLHTITTKRPTVWLMMSDDHMYIKVWQNGLRYAEVLPLRTTEDILYYVAELDKEFKIKDFSILISGNGAKDRGKLLKKYFKRVKCE